MRELKQQRELNGSSLAVASPAKEPPTSELRRAACCPLSCSLCTRTTAPRPQTPSKLSNSQMTLIGLIDRNGEDNYRNEVARICNWCKNNNLVLNAAKTVELIVDFRKLPPAPLPVYIDGSEVSRVQSVRFLGSTLTSDLKWEQNTTRTQKKAQQRLFFLRQLKKFGMSRDLLTSFYSATIESILCCSIIVWYAGATAKDKYKLYRVIKTAEKIIGAQLPSLDLLYSMRMKTRASKILLDPSHPGRRYFETLPLGRRLRYIPAKTTRRMNTFFPQAVLLLNSLNSKLPPPPPTFQGHSSPRRPLLSAVNYD
ncbi:uncharacterized protein [Hyperolius riggenbachi]